MRTILFLVAIILLVLGVISWLTPIPGGTIALATGLALLICTSERTARFIAGCRTRFPRFNAVICFIENKVPAKLSEPLMRTRPNADDTPPS